MICYPNEKKTNKKDVGHPNPNIGQKVNEPSHIFKRSGLKDDLVQRFRESFEQ